jgi:hypothetical protein
MMGSTIAALDYKRSLMRLPALSLEEYAGIEAALESHRLQLEGDAFRAEKPRLWSDARYKTRGTFRPFDLHPDGKRFALAPAAAAGAMQDHVTVIFNVFDELRRIAPNR